MVVSHLKLNNFRSHKLIEVDLNPNVTIILGKNGSGKTSILEAIYYLARGGSFKGTAGEILKIGESWWKIEADIDGDKLLFSLDNSGETIKKVYKINEHKHARLPIKYRRPVVLFEPDDLRLINGSPSRRRKFIDEFISQLDVEYSHSLRKYEKALKQRNNLLKREVFKPSDMFVWNIALSKYGSYIVDKRIAFIEKINSEINELYQKISRSNDLVGVHYSHTLIQNSEQKLFSELDKSLERDRLVGSTSVGPHRHDILFSINNSPANSTASRGENRTIVLTLKFIEIDIIEKITGEKPLVLLDDVFSELDTDRQTELSRMTAEHQVIITSVDSPLKDGLHTTIKL